MIVFELQCRAGGHRFEGWFGSSDDFRSQQQRGLVACPKCDSTDISKAPMAPNLARKGNQVTVPLPAAKCPETAAAAIMAAAQASARGAGRAALSPEAVTLPPQALTVPREALSPDALSLPPEAPTLPPQAPTLPPQAVAMMQAIVRMQAEALKTSKWVGKKFADDARAMHYGEKDQAPIHGQATAQEARDLLEEGVEIAPILFPLVPPGQVN